MSLMPQLTASLGAGMEIAEPFPAAPLALALWPAYRRQAGTS